MEDDVALAVFVLTGVFVLIGIFIFIAWATMTISDIAVAGVGLLAIAIFFCLLAVLPWDEKA